MSTVIEQGEGSARTDSDLGKSFFRAAHPASTDDGQGARCTVGPAYGGWLWDTGVTATKPRAGGVGPSSGPPPCPAGGGVRGPDRTGCLVVRGRRRRRRLRWRPAAPARPAGELVHAVTGRREVALTFHGAGDEASPGGC